jgi:hypothetical protein
MGIFNFGIPIREALAVSKILNLDIFVETGTYEGRSALKMSQYFKRVYTIESSDNLFKISQHNLKNFDNIVAYLGDSRKILNSIIEIENNVLFWLDAHWSGGNTYGENDECPVIEELNAIFKHKKNYAILIDDARLFIAPPPLPHNFLNWPSILDISNTIPKDFDLLIHDDVIYIFPISYHYELRKYFQDLITNEWSKRNRFIFKFLRRVERAISRD